MIATAELSTGAAPDSPWRLLGEQIRHSSGRPDDSATGLRALVVFTAEYARLQGASLDRYLAGLESTIDGSAADLSPPTRERIRFAILHWARLAFAEAHGPPPEDSTD